MPDWNAGQPELQQLVLARMVIMLLPALPVVQVIPLLAAHLRLTAVKLAILSQQQLATLTKNAKTVSV